MGNTPASQPAETPAQLVLRAQIIDALVQNGEDWRVLGLIAARMLFWCGGAIYACRCEGNEMRFALQVLHAPLGAIAHQIASAYGTHVRKTRSLRGSIFRHYCAVPVHDDISLEELVLWLHRSEKPLRSSGLAASGLTSQLWTADGAYLVPNSLSWINTERVLREFSVGAPGPATHLHRKLAPFSPRFIELVTHPPPRKRRKPLSDQSTQISGRIGQGARAAHSGIEMIAWHVAECCKVSYEDMLSNTRKRAVSKARVIATVLATRRGATAAAAARLFNRSRSTLIEQVEHYRTTQPDMFAEAESQLEAHLAGVRT